MGNLQFVKNFPNRAFAEQAKDHIGCVLKSPDLGILGTTSSSTLNGVDLYVEETEFKRAHELLNALFNGI